MTADFFSRLPRAAFLAAIASTAPVAPEPAGAGAWTQAPGASFIALSNSTYGADDGGYEEIYASIYAEHGFREGITLGGALELTTPTGRAAPLDDTLTASAFARFRLRVGAAGDPVSVQIGALYEGGGVEAGAPLQRAGDGLDIDLRGLYGRGFPTALGDAYFDAQAAFRIRTGDPADELRLDLTLGLRPEAPWLGENWLVVAQSFGVLSLRNEAEGRDGFDSLKLAPSLAYRIGPGLTAGVGAEREIAGRNIDKGLRLKAFVWREF